MAGIIAHVDDDISKLRALKKEIEGVKASLTNINVKVDIDIKQGLEAQLKSLVGQYDALAQKIAETEGRIANSVANINSITEKIISGQNRVIEETRNSGGSAGGQSTAGIEQANAEQAHSYNELRQQIEAVIGSKAANLKLLHQEEVAIRSIKGIIAELNKAEEQNGFLTDKQRAYLDRLNEELVQRKQSVSELNIIIRQQVKEEQAAEGSMKQLGVQLGLMRAAYRDLTEAEKDSPFGKQLLASIQQADEAIKGMDATIGNYQRNVGNYASGWNGLNMSIQQLARELPSLAYGPQIFFSAISNNLPILADELKRATAEYNRLKAAGENATPVWKQILTSLVSWQTALTVGITLLTVYGKEIWEWVKNMFNGGEAARIAAENLKIFNQALEDASKKASSELINIKNLYNATQDLTKSYNERLAKAGQLIEIGGKVFDGLNAEAVVAGKAANAYKTLSNGIIAYAKAQAYAKKYQEAFQKDLNFRLQQERKEAMFKGRESDIILYKELRAGYDEYIRKSRASGLSGVDLVTPEDEVNYKKFKEFEKANRDFVKNLEEYWEAVDDEGILDNMALMRQLERKMNAELKNAGVYKEEEVESTKTLVQLTSNIVAKEKELADVRAKANAGKAYTSNVKAVEDELNALKQEYQTRTGNAYGKTTIPTSSARAENHLQKIEEAQAKANAILFKLNADNAEQEVALNENTEERKLAEIELGFNKRKAEIAKQAEELKQLNKDAGTIGLNAEGLTTEQQNAVDKANDLNEANKAKQISDYQQEQKEELDAMLADVLTYQQRRTAIEEEYAKKRKALYNDGDESKGLREGVTQDNVNEVKRQEEEALTALDSEVASREESFQAWVNSIADMGLWKLKELLTQAEEEVKKAGENATPEQRAKLATLTQATNEAEAEYKANPKKAEMSDWQKVSSSLKKVASASKELGAEFKEMGGDFGEVAGRILEDASDIANSTFTIIDGIKSLTTGSIEGMTATSQGASEAIKGVEKASVILAIISAAIQITMKIINLVKDLSDRDNNKIIESNQKKIDNLKDSYERLSETAEEAFGESKANAIAQMNRNLERQKALIEGQKRAEQEKKKADEEALAQYDDKLKEINDQIKENAKEAEEAIYGEGMQSAIDRFASSYADAVASGTSKWEGAKNFVKDSIKKMTMEAIKGALQSSEAIAKIRAKLDEFFKDGIITIAEENQLNEMAEKAMAELDAKFGWANRFMADDTTEQEAASRGISSLTQEQGEELNGRFTALQIAGEAIRTQSEEQTQQMALLVTTSAELKAMSEKSFNALEGVNDQIAQMYLEVQEINANTSASASYLKVIKDDIAAVKKNTENLV